MNQAALPSRLSPTVRLLIAPGNFSCSELQSPLNSDADSDLLAINLLVEQSVSLSSWKTFFAIKTTTKRIAHFVLAD
jgi:hypothetical protein